MYLKRRIEEILSDASSGRVNETQLLSELRRLIAEYDCDSNFHCGSALDIPPAAYIRSDCVAANSSPTGAAAEPELQLDP